MTDFWNGRFKVFMVNMGHRDSYFLYDGRRRCRFSAEVVLYKKTPAQIIRDKKMKKK